MKRSLASLIIAWVMVPLMGIGTVSIGLFGLYRTYLLSETAQQQAQRVARVVAIASQTQPPQPRLVADQTSELLISSPRIKTINYYPLSVAVPIRKNTTSALSSQITYSEPVENSLGESGSRLSGYINVTMDIWPEQKKLIYQSMVFIVFCLAVIAGFSFWLFQLLSRDGRYSVFNNLTALVELAGDHMPLQTLELKKSSSVDTVARFERALLDLDSRLQHAKMQVKNATAELQVQQKFNRSSNFAKTSFQSMVTHELRNPLNAMSGGLQLLDTRAFSGENLQAIRLVEQGHRQIQHLLDQVIELSELQENQVTSQECEVAIESFLRQVVQRYSERLVQNGLELSLNINHNPTEVLVDAGKLSAILGYLIDNAIKFTPKGSLRIDSDLGLTQWPNVLSWSIRVSDTGVGIAPQVLDRVFEPYFQVDSSHQREFEGVGLGLTLAEKTAEIIGAQITVQSKPEQGTTFQVQLNASHTESSTSRTPLRGMRILYLFHPQAQALEKHLQSAGAIVNGFEVQALALVSFEQIDYDLVLISQFVEPNAAMSFAQRCREMENEHRAMIIYMSAEARDSEDFQASGIDHVTALLTPLTLVNYLANWRI